MTMVAAVATAQSVKLSTYPGRPASIAPPHAFVDVLRESIEYVGHLMQRTVQADLVIVWGAFDSKAATEQKDAFADDLIAYVRTQVHAAGANTTIGVVSTEDDPTFLPDWLPREQQRTYYATRVTLEGYAEE